MRRQSRQAKGWAMPNLLRRTKSVEGLEARLAALEARLEGVAAELAELRGSQQAAGRADR